jgi:hypothetical protein
MAKTRRDARLEGRIFSQNLAYFRARLRNVEN